MYTGLSESEARRPGEFVAVAYLKLDDLLEQVPLAEGFGRFAGDLESRHVHDHAVDFGLDCVIEHFLEVAASAEKDRVGVVGSPSGASALRSSTSARTDSSFAARFCSVVSSRSVSARGQSLARLAVRLRS